MRIQHPEGRLPCLSQPKISIFRLCLNVAFIFSLTTGWSTECFIMDIASMHSSPDSCSDAEVSRRVFGPPSYAGLAFVSDLLVLLR